MLNTEVMNNLETTFIQFQLRVLELSKLALVPTFFISGVPFDLQFGTDLENYPFNLCFVGNVRICYFSQA